MADVTLRAYVKEVDDLIERDQLDEAIAHCRHILQIYPKHLGTYRLLGKAYLEAKRFGDAADIFQRVLSVMPEDFVSHIGMAIVREDEGNLDAAIWHMERAFEANPANPAIRQELSRLIGRRDGLEPHKIRLTRGALARQYAQGELYPQAIAELRSALQEDPDRPDLEILLARMYWQSEQFDTAKTLCKQILEKLPYSFDANRIMAAIYQDTNNPEKAAEFHRRLAGLDPYMAFVDSAASDPSEVSGTAVRIDHGDWMPGQPLPAGEQPEPGWVSSLGVDLSEDEVLQPSESVPTWMSELEGEVHSRPEGSAAVSTPGMEGALSEEGDIPEWMREAGWEPSNGEVVEGSVQFSDSELNALDSGGPMPTPHEERGEEEEIAPADIPDWLQDIAPSEIPAVPEPASEADDAGAGQEEFVPDWLADISDEADEVPPEPVEETQEVRTPQREEREPAAVVSLDGEDKPEVPTWVEDQTPGATSTIISWLGDRPGSEEDEEAPVQESEPESVGASMEAAQPDSEVEIPSWLEGLDVEEPEAAAPDDTSDIDEEVPSWLAGVADAASDIDMDLGAGMEQPDEGTPRTAAGVTEEPSPPADDEAWLRDLAEADLEEPDQTSGSEIADAVPADGLTPEVPNWLDDLAEDERIEAPTEPEPEWLSGLDVDEIQEEPTVAASRQKVPDWLQGIADPSTTEGEPAPAGSEIPPAGEDDVALSRLRDMAAGEGELEQAEDELDLQALRQFEQEISTDTESVDSEMVRPPEEIGMGEDLDDEEVYQWLESLSQDQEADAGAGITQSTVAGEGTDESHKPILDEAVPPDAPEEGLDWLEDLATKRGLDVDVTPQEDTSQIPIKEPEPQATAPETRAEEEAPDWLREMASAPSDETVIAARPPEFETASTAPQAESPQQQDDTGWLEEVTSVAEDVPAEPPTTDQATPSSTAEPVPPIEAREVPEIPAPEFPAVEAPATPSDLVEPTPLEPAVEMPVEAIEGTPTEALPEEPGAEPAGFKEPMTEPTQLLQSARQAMSAGDAGRALSDYRKLVERKQDLDTVIVDLQRAAERYPNLPKVWQALGDAYMKADQLPEAITAYKRGMEVA